MIGTLFCRNCDTAFEVSDGDVAKFQVSPVFLCTVCQADLSAQMAGIVGQPIRDPSEELTVPDDDGGAYDGLPMGESFDQAAEKLRTNTEPAPKTTAGVRPPDSTLADTMRSTAPPLAARARPSASMQTNPMADTVRLPEPPLVARGREVTPEPTPVVRTPEPTPIMPEPTPIVGQAIPPAAEDPVQMALRMAAQAAAQAAEMEPAREPIQPMPTPIANGGADASEITGVAIRWKAPTQAPIAARNGSAGSTDAGVVPEEPDNETTQRGEGAAQRETTEPTLPSSANGQSEASVAEEPTPFVAPPEGDAIPESELAPPALRKAAATPPAARPVPFPQPPRFPEPPAFPEPPQEEVTIRKSSPPPPIAVMRTAAKLARAGTGPASVGALGIRVAFGRPLVRPGGGSVPTRERITGSNPIVTQSETAISGGGAIPPRFEPSRTPSTGSARPPAPSPVIDTVAPRASAPRRDERRIPFAALMGGGVLIFLLVVAATYFLVKFIRQPHAGDDVTIPATETVAIETPVQEPSIAIVPTQKFTATPVQTAAPATPRSTPSAIAIHTAPPTTPPTRPPASATPVRTVATPVSTPTRVAVATTPAPTPRLAKSSKDAIEKVLRDDTWNSRSPDEMRGLLNDLRQSQRLEPPNEELAWAITRAESSLEKKGQAVPEFREDLNYYLSHFPNKNQLHQLQVNRDLANLH